MAYSSKNKEKIKYFKENPEIVYEEYIVNGKTNAQLTKEWGLPKSTVHEIIRSAGLVVLNLARN